GGERLDLPLRPDFLLPEQLQVRLQLALLYLQLAELRLDVVAFGLQGLDFDGHVRLLGAPAGAGSRNLPRGETWHNTTRRFSGRLRRTDPCGDLGLAPGQPSATTRFRPLCFAAYRR